MKEQLQNLRSLKYPLDGPHYHERSVWTKLDKIQIPAYFGCHWMFYQHLRGPFSAWMGTGDITKRMLIGPTPMPGRPFAAYHMEALRWYDCFLKGMDSGVLDGAPIHLWIHGEDIWRDEHEWPLDRTKWMEFYLGGTVGNGTLTDTPPIDGEQTLDYDPSSEQCLWGQPRWVYRSRPLDQPMEITGPIQLNLEMASTAIDTDWVVTLFDEAPDGKVREITRSWQRSSHRAVDSERSRQNQPWHPHDRIEPLTPNKPEEVQIEVIPACNLFHQGHRIRLELANCDSLVEYNAFYKRTLLIPARNTVIQGRGQVPNYLTGDSALSDLWCPTEFGGTRQTKQLFGKSVKRCWQFVKKLRHRELACEALHSDTHYSGDSAVTRNFDCGLSDFTTLRRSARDHDAAGGFTGRHRASSEPPRAGSAVSPSNTGASSAARYRAISVVRSCTRGPPSLLSWSASRQPSN